MREPTPVIFWEQSVIVVEGEVRRVGSLLLTDDGVVFVQLGAQSHDRSAMARSGGMSGVVVDMWGGLARLLSWVIGGLMMRRQLDVLDEIGSIDPELLYLWCAQNHGSFRRSWSQVRLLYPRAPQQVCLQTTLGERYIFTVSGDADAVVGRMNRLKAQHVAAATGSGQGLPAVSA